MSGQFLNKKIFKPVAPDRGSFPLDHDNVCKKFMVEYMVCLSDNNQDNSKCRAESKAYLACRMENMLMAKEEWMNTEKKHVLLCCTGSVATIKAINIIEQLLSIGSVEIKVIFTKYASHFCDSKSIIEAGALCYKDEDEWSAWQKRGDPVVHIELGKWADLLLIAPLDANTLAKISQGICDNLLTATVRAWDLNKPLLFCPAMNTRMWNHPITTSQVSQLKEWGYIEIPCISKTLMCKDVGLGAMAEPETIVDSVKKYLLE